MKESGMSEQKDWFALSCIGEIQKKINLTKPSILLLWKWEF